MGWDVCLQVETQRDQLRQSEEKASLANELQVKMETLQDELAHKCVPSLYAVMFCTHTQLMWTEKGSMSLAVVWWKT
jgi:hypothetical protein